MITKYKLYKESLLNKLDGPSEDEIIDNLKNNPNKLLKYSIENNFKRGIEIALSDGAKI